MALHRSSMSVSIAYGLLNRSLELRRFDLIRHGPSCRIMLLEIELATHPSADHRVGNGKFLRADSEIHVNRDQRDQSDARKSVQDVHQSPGHVTEQKRIAWK